MRVRDVWKLKPGFYYALVDGGDGLLVTIMRVTCPRYYTHMHLLELGRSDCFYSSDKDSDSVMIGCWQVLAVKPIEMLSVQDLQND